MLRNVIWPNASIIINEICNSELKERATKDMRYSSVDGGNLNSYTPFSMSFLSNRREGGQVTMGHQETQQEQERQHCSHGGRMTSPVHETRKGSFNLLLQFVPGDFSSSSLINIRFLLLAVELSPHMFMRQWTCVPIVNMVVFTRDTSVSEVVTTIFRLPKLFHYKSMSNCF